MVIRIAHDMLYHFRIWLFGEGQTACGVSFWRVRPDYDVSRGDPRQRAKLEWPDEGVGR